MVRTRLTYILIALIALAVFVCTNAFAALVVFIAALALPIACKIAVKRQAKGVSMRCSCVGAATVDGELALTIAIRRPKALLKGRIELEFESTNLLTRSKSSVPVVLGISEEKTEVYHLRLSTRCCGCCAIKLTAARLRDPLGLTSVPLDLSYEGTYTVYPPLCELDIASSQLLQNNATGAAYDMTRKGQDQTEIFDLRAYEQTDTIASIHWKATAKVDKLMVREASWPVDYDVMLLCDARMPHISNDDEVRALNATMAAAASLSLALCTSGQSHCVGYVEAGELAAVPVQLRENFDAALDALMSMPLSDEPLADAAAFQLYQRSHAITRAILVSSAPSDELAQQLAATTNLAVVVVEDAAEQQQACENYLRTSIPASRLLAGRVKSVVI